MRLLFRKSQPVSFEISPVWFLSVQWSLTVYSGWIEDTNINPYNEHKEQMVKAGKSKGTFNKAVKEIEDFMKDPAVSAED